MGKYFLFLNTFGAFIVFFLFCFLLFYFFSMKSYMHILNIDDYPNIFLINL